MRRRKIKEKQPTLRLAFLFCVLVVSLLAISAIARIGILIQNSRFDGQHRFSLLAQDTSAENSGYIISFSPIDKTIVALHVLRDGDIPTKTIGMFLGVPVDGYMKVTYPVLLKGDKDIAIFFESSLFSFSNVQTNLTIIDIIRFLFFSKTTPGYSIKIQNSLGQLSQLDELVKDKIISNLFVDPAIVEEKTSIQVVNGTGISGLGNRFAQLITNMGGNVIAVTTADTTLQTTSIFYYDQKNYTVQKFEKLLKVSPMPLLKREISDIIIILGKDRQNLLEL